MSVALQTGGGRCGATGSTFNFHSHPHPHPPRFISITTTTTTTTLPFMAMHGACDPPIGGADSGSGTSSIGKNSDLSAGDLQGDDAGDDEAQSEMKDPLDSMYSLQDVLPVKRGISKYYNGKSRRFRDLAEASAVSSINDLAKPESPYDKKRKNKFSSTLDLEKNAGKTSKHIRTGPYKPQASGTRITLNSLAAIPVSETNSCDKTKLSSSSSLNRLLPLRPPSTKGSSPGTEAASPPSEQSILPSRPHSLADSQSASVSASPSSVSASPSSVSASPSSSGASLPCAGASLSSAGAAPPSASSSGGK